MSTTIRRVGAAPFEDLSSVIHHLPCHIAHTGAAAVSDFFLPTIRKENPQVVENSEDDCTAAFRGRPLNGKTVNLSPTYTGLILEEPSTKKKSSLVEKDDQREADRWNVVGKFDSMTYWNWDKLPTDSDGLHQLLQWTRLAEAMQTSARDIIPVGGDFVDSDTESA
ncbi:hypothetical protein BV898_16386 [Hypsibius exemplaris]|uniref:Uncharacterized protein n=1 Tax=Hypsibius exemplaris TaxID=2072580 RepID=A0A9X6NK59_HYPEX|nr:hypothetical protein BV898_16386 [Hypsibius exemplaris]